MDRLPNPFTPTFGLVPRRMAGREEVLGSLSRALEDGLGNPDLSSIIMGARGTGKTVLLSLIGEEALSRGWVSVGVNAGSGMLAEIADLTRAATARYASVEESPRIKGVTVGQLLGVEWDWQEPPAQTWRLTMSNLLDQLATYDIGLLITVDEVDAAELELIKLASTYQHFVRERRKVGLVMAGLPHKVSQLLTEESVTFLRRSSLFQLGRIPDYEMTLALEETALLGGGHIEHDALDMLVDSIDGYPYMMQLAGYRSWERSSGGIITKEAAASGIAAAAKEIDYRILGVTFRALSPRERDFLAAMAQDKEPVRQATIAKRMGVTGGYVSEYKRRLLEQGVIEEVSRGEVAFALPGLRDYVLREMGDEIDGNA